MTSYDGNTPPDDIRYYVDDPNTAVVVGVDRAGNLVGPEGAVISREYPDIAELCRKAHDPFFPGAFKLVLHAPDDVSPPRPVYVIATPALGADLTTEDAIREAREAMVFHRHIGMERIRLSLAKNPDMRPHRLLVTSLGAEHGDVSPGRRDMIDTMQSVIDQIEHDLGVDVIHLGPAPEEPKYENKPVPDDDDGPSGPAPGM